MAPYVYHIHLGIREKIKQLVKSHSIVPGCWKDIQCFPSLNEDLMFRVLKCFSFFLKQTFISMFV